MRVGSLFAGIGGFDLGFERAGMHTVWQVEQDPYCRAVLAKHFPDAERFEDVREVGASNLAPVDVICGGFPCQDLSVAGKGGGITAARSGLWSEFARIIGELRPRYVVVENVPALTRNEWLGRVLGDLASCGYDAEWDCIPASAVGAPHRRDRIWLVAYPNADAGRLEVGSKRDRQPQRPGQRAPQRSNADRLRDDVADAEGRHEPDQSGLHDEGRPLVGSGSRAGGGAERRDLAAGGREPGGDRVAGSEVDVADAARDAQAGPAPTTGAERQRARPGGQRSGAAADSNGERSQGGGAARSTAPGRRQPGDAGSTAVADPEGQPERTGLRSSGTGGKRGRRPGDGGGAGGAGWWAVEPDVGRVADGVPARVDRLSALGNALVPQIAEWIGRRILEHEEGGVAA